MHLFLAWAYVIIVLASIGGLAYWRWAEIKNLATSVETLRSDGAEEAQLPRSGPGSRIVARGADSPQTLYSIFEPYASMVKAAIQMAIAIIAVCVVGWQFLHSWPATTAGATALLLDGIGVGLAAAAVVELAYTLFTPGPDEALDPLMLGVSATLLIQLGKPDVVTVQRAGAFLLLGLLLAVLFAVRLLLAERRSSEDRPRVWWVSNFSKK
jgi:hypothetical protein